MKIEISCDEFDLVLNRIQTAIDNCFDAIILDDELGEFKICSPQQ